MSGRRWPFEQLISPSGGCQGEDRRLRASTGEEAGHSAQAEGFWSPFKCGPGIFHACKEVPIWIKEYSIRNVGLDEAQGGIKISRRNSNNLTCAGNTTLMAKSKE